MAKKKALNEQEIGKALSTALGIKLTDIEISGTSLFLGNREVGISEVTLTKKMYQLKAETKNLPSGAPIVAIYHDQVLGFLSADTVRRRSSALNIRFALEDLLQIREINQSPRSAQPRVPHQRSPR